MSYPVVVTSQAEEEIDETAIYLAVQNQTLEQAEAFYDAVDETRRAIAEHPTRRPLSIHRTPGDKSLRHQAITGFPNHLIFYRFDGQQVKVVRLLHAARDLPRQFE